MKLVCFLIFNLKLGLILGQTEGPIVTIPDGGVRGTVNQTAGRNITFYAFRGIPFAKPPIGQLRFASPVKNDPWTGIRDATQDKDSCTQSSSPVIGVPGGVVGSEDCLYINVYTTALNGSLPVMVWIYGGGFVGGSSTYSVYAPDYLIERNVIYVSFNYRLGVFGFLSTEDSSAYGNWGLKDQVLALKWVKDNIQYFGGDPSKVTIFGESAGSASVSYLVQSKLTTGLYRGAIMQSGSSLCLWALTLNARHKAFSVGAVLGIITLSSRTLINNLRNTDYQKLSLAEGNVTFAAVLTDNILAGLPFGVVKEPDHPDAVFSSSSHELQKQGAFNKVPLVIGYNSNEGGALQAYVDAIRPVFFQYDIDTSRLAPYDLRPAGFGKLLASIEIRNRYFSFGPIENQPLNITKFFTVDQFNRPIRESARLLPAYTNVYYYRFSYVGLLGNPNPTYEGVGHADELRYLFAGEKNPGPEDNLIRDKFVTLWTNFAKTGDPTPLEIGTSLENLKWEPNAPTDNTSAIIKYLNINTTLAMETNPNQVDWEFYQRIYSRYGVPPYTTY